jgi:hypothetical protein
MEEGRPIEAPREQTGRVGRVAQTRVSQHVCDFSLNVG